MLTLLGLGWAIGAAVAIAKGYFLLGGFLLLLSGAFDLFDGTLARATSQVTKFGALLDSTIDRLCEAAIFLGLLSFYLGQSFTWGPLLIFIAFVGSILVSYIRARGEGMGVKCEVGIFTRAERVIVLALGLLLTPVYSHSILIALGILAVLAWVTVIQRLVYIRQQIGRG